MPWTDSFGGWSSSPPRGKGRCGSMRCWRWSTGSPSTGPAWSGSDRQWPRSARRAAASMRLLQVREMLLDRADDSGIAGVGEQAKPVPEAKGGLQRAGAGFQPPRLGVHAPPPRPQGAEIPAAAPPQAGAPLATIEVPERVVDPGRLPVDDAGQPVAI